MIDNAHLTASLLMQASSATWVSPSYTLGHFVFVIREMWSPSVAYLFISRVFMQASDLGASPKSLQ